MGKVVLNDINTGYASNSALDANFDIIEAAFDNTVSRDGSTPNQMQADFDLNSFDILNGGSVDVSDLSIDGVNVVPTALATSVLPDQTGHSGKYLTTNGSTASWDLVDFTYANVAALVATTTLSPGDTVQTEGYYSGGDGGQSTYYIKSPAGFGGTPDEYGDLTLGNGNIAVLQHHGIVDVRQYGVVSTASDNAAALSACFTAAKSGAFKVSAYSGETYDYQSDITITSATLFSLEGDATFNGISSGIYISGTITEIGTVASTATKDDTTIVLSAVGTFAAGDIAVFWNSTTSSYSPHRTNYYDGEFARVKSVAGSTLTLDGPLLTSYAVAATNIAYKIVPVIATITGCSFTGGSLYALQIKQGAHCVIAPTLVENTALNQSAALSLNRCYQSRVVGGRYFRENGASGTDYGIGIANSQGIIVDGVDAYARRHATSCGGDANPGAVPCRYIKIINSTLANDPAASIYNADFHGNTIDSYYKGCTIYGSIGLAGENVSAIECNIHSFANNDAPLIYHELVGGDLKFIDCKITQDPTNTANYVLTNASSALTANITKAYNVYLIGCTMELTTNTTQLVNAYENSGQVNSWYIEDFEATGSLGSYTAIFKFTNVGGADPTLLYILRPRYNVTVSYVSGTIPASTIQKRPSSIGSNANGSYQKFEDGTMICNFDFSASTDIPTAFLGGYRSGGLTWTYPVAFTAAPEVAITPDSSTAFAATISASAASNCLFFLNAVTSQTAATRSAKMIAIGKWF